MMTIDVLKYKLFRDKNWANEKLRWFLREILYSPSWEKHPQNKVILARQIISDLEDHGFWWQAARVENHLHRWMAQQKGKGRG